MLCVLCHARPPSPSGEHVWERWLTKRFASADGPYTWYKNDQPIRKRDGTIRTHTSFGAVKLPVCTDCNAELNNRFGLPAKSIVRRVLDNNARVMLDANECVRFGSWLLKTWLLLAHPAVRYSEPAVRPRTWNLDEKAEDLYAWLTCGDPAPDGFSVWITRRRPSKGRSNPIGYIPLPTIVVDGQPIAFEVRRAGLGDLDVSLVYHPGWPILHQGEHDGHALRMWPPSSEISLGQADLRTLFSTNAKDVDWIDGPRIQFKAGSCPSDGLPPLSVGFDPYSPEFLRSGSIVSLSSPR